GGAACHCRPPCPRAAPREWVSIVPTGDAYVGATPLRAGRGCCPYGLAAGKHRPLQAGRRRALPRVG
ncbi:hypothetical protein BHM03_00055616, partial [Ensete ventricosum]